MLPPAHLASSDVPRVSVLVNADAGATAAARQRLRRDAQASLRKLVEVLPAHVTAEIMVASEKVLGTARDVGLN